MFTKHQSLGPFLGLRHLDKHAPDQKGIDDRSEDRLEQKEDDPLGALVCDVSVAISYSGFGLYEEKKGWGKVIDVGHTWSVLVIVGFVEVSSDVRDEPPHRGHEEPSDRVGEDENKKIPAPFQIYQCRE